MIQLAQMTDVSNGSTRPTAVSNKWLFVDLFILMHVLEVYRDIEQSTHYMYCTLPGLIHGHCLSE